MTVLVGFVDIETTGKFTFDHRIIELSLRVHNLDSRIEKRDYLQRFNPERNIDAKALAVHHIPREALESEPTFQVALPKLVEALSDVDLLVAHNGYRFDFPFIRQEVERVGGVMPDIAEFDTMVEGTFATDLGKNPTLRELCYSLDVEYDNDKAHSGDYDTFVMKECFFKGIDFEWYNI